MEARPACTPRRGRPINTATDTAVDVFLCRGGLHGKHSFGASPFLAHLAQQQMHDDVRQFAHLMLNHLQLLAEPGTARRGRSAS